MAEEELHDHDRGLAFDLATLVRRRNVLGLVAGAGMATLVGCSAGDGGSEVDQSPTATGAAATNPGISGVCSKIPEETAGPFPADGSNGPNVLTQSGIVRRDIRPSFGSSTGMAAGVPLTITLTVLNLSDGCTPFQAAAVYLWHCDQDGNYSLYSAAAGDQNYLRGVQSADAAGKVTFQSIFPAAYSGRWPHIHYEVYPNLTTATSAGSKLATSQIALPEAICRTVYGASGYQTSARNLASTSLAGDNVFKDGWSRELGAVTGDVTSGYICTVTVAV